MRTNENTHAMIKILIIADRVACMLRFVDAIVVENHCYLYISHLCIHTGLAVTLALCGAIEWYIDSPRQHARAFKLNVCSSPSSTRAVLIRESWQTPVFVVLINNAHLMPSTVEIACIALFIYIYIYINFLAAFKQLKYILYRGVYKCTTEITDRFWVIFF